MADRSAVKDAENKPGPLGRLRARYGWIDHLVRAATLYSERNADVLAASITYFGFLALFPLLLLAASVFGFVLASRPDLLDDAISAIADFLPGSAGDQVVEALNAAIDSRGAVGIVGLLGLLYAGLGWISKMRLAIQTLWRGQPAPPSFLKDNARDLLTLIGLGGGLLLSLIVTAVGTAAASFVVELVGISDVPGITILTGALAIVLAVAGSTLIFSWLFGSLSGHDISYRSVLPGALLAAVGFEILKLVGGFYLSLVSGNVSAGVFGSVVGMLLFIYLACRFLLFCVAWTATLPRFARLGLGPGGAVGIPGGAAERKPGARVGWGKDGGLGSSADDGAIGEVVDAARPGAPGTGPREPVPAAKPAAVAAGLVATGAVVAAVARPVVRRWWRGQPLLGVHKSKREQ